MFFSRNLLQVTKIDKYVGGHHEIEACGINPSQKGRQIGFHKLVIELSGLRLGEHLGLKADSDQIARMRLYLYAEESGAAPKVQNG